MKKLGIILDSFSGMSNKEYEKLGFEYVNQTVIIDGEIFHEGFDGTLKDIIDKIEASQESKTSMPAIGKIVDKFEEVSKKYEHVIFLPMNAGMSSTYSVSAAAANDFKNIDVIPTKFIGHAFVYVGQKAIEMANNGKSIEEIKKYINDVSKTSSAWAIPFTLDRVIKGGRLKGVKKFILEKGKLTPRLFVTDDGVISRGVKRTFKKAVSTAIDKCIEDIGGEEKIKDYIFELIQTGNKDNVDMTSQLLKDKGIKEFNIIFASAATGAHTGKGSIGINAYKK